MYVCMYVCSRLKISNTFFSLVLRIREKTNFFSRVLLFYFVEVS